MRGIVVPKEHEDRDSVELLAADFAKARNSTDSIPRLLNMFAQCELTTTWDGALGGFPLPFLLKYSSNGTGE